MDPEIGRGIQHAHTIFVDFSVHLGMFGHVFAFSAYMYDAGSCQYRVLRMCSANHGDNDDSAT